jgi:DUF1680 family protein
MYLLTAVADMVCIDNQPLRASSDWKNTLYCLWNNMVDKKMYLTGGIGAIKQWEGFGRDYFLPQSTDEGGCYAETCASIAVVMLAERLLHIDLDGRFADVLELCLYNNVMTSMSLDGNAFTYVNQLGSSESDKSVREEWFWCACCPPNVTRLYGSLGGYLWDFGETSKDEVYINVHLYSKAVMKFKVAGQEVSLEQDSDWPWDGLVKFRLSAPESLKTTIQLRVPGWSRGQYHVSPEPSQGSISLHKGYITLDPAYVAKYAQFSLNIGNFKPVYVAPHPYTNQRTLTLTRGPLVYCMEDADNTWEYNHFKDIGIKASTVVDEERKQVGEEDYVALKTSCWRRTLEDTEAGVAPGSVVDCDENTGAKMEAIFVPYYLRANRGGNGHMRVGLNRI